MLKKSDVIEKNKFHIRVQHTKIYQNQLLLSLSFFSCCTVISCKTGPFTVPSHYSLELLCFVNLLAILRNACDVEKKLYLE